MVIVIGLHRLKLMYLHVILHVILDTAAGAPAFLGSSGLGLESVLVQG